MGRPPTTRPSSSGARESSRIRRPPGTGSSASSSGGSKFERSKTSEVRSFDARSDRDVLTRPTKDEWQGVRGNSLIVSAQYNYNLYDSYHRVQHRRRSPGEQTSSPRRSPASPVHAGESQVVAMKQTRGAVTWYKPNWFYGNHELKAGFEYSVHGKVLRRRRSRW